MLKENLIGALSRGTAVPKNWKKNAVKPFEYKLSALQWRSLVQYNEYKSSGQRIVVVLFCGKSKISLRRRIKSQQTRTI
jgi:hypothetical protein